jgi:pterin-4a-carbinolamine dehydratase
MIRREGNKRGRKNKTQPTGKMSLSREKLVGEERERRLREEVPYWQQVSCKDAIQRTYTFKDFKEAWKFMNLTAEKAEAVPAHT